MKSSRLTRLAVLIGLSLIVLIASVVAGKVHDKQLARQKSSNAKIQFEDKTKEPYFAKEFSECPRNLSGLLTKEPMALSLIDYIAPLGMMNSTSHTIPTDHMYMNYIAPAPQRYPIYAPGNLSALRGDNKVTYYSDTNRFKEDDFSIEFVVCRGLTMYLNHFSELAPVISDAYKNSIESCDSKKSHFGNDMTTYYLSCNYMLNLKVKAGDLLGYIGGLQHQQGIDIGMYNHNTAPLAYISPRRYSEDNLHAVCPFDIFTPGLKSAYYRKIGDWVTLTKDKSQTAGGYFAPRTVEPICGENMYDVLGTARGNWFAGTVKLGSVTQTQYMMALAPYNVDPNRLKISIKGPKEVGGYVDVVFTPTHSGTYNRDFAEVKADGQIYCYRGGPNIRAVTGKSGYTPVDSGPKILLQLVDARHLRIESQSGACTSPEQFGTPFSFER